MISVIIPCFNVREEWLRKSIGSVLSQTWSDLEVIVVDDCSEVQFSGLDKEIFDPRVHWLKNHENLGVSKTRNRGASKAQGKWLAFLDADDWWAPEKLRLQIEQLEKDNACWGYTSAYMTRADGKIIHTVPAEYRGNIYKEVLSRMIITGSASAVIAEKNLFLQLGGFDETGEIEEDWDMWIRLAKVAEVSCVNQVLVYIRHSPAGRSSGSHQISRVIALQKKHNKAIEEQGLQALSRAHLSSIKAKRSITERKYILAAWHGILNMFFTRDFRQLYKALKWMNIRFRR